MKGIFFDASTLISFALTCTLKLLDRLNALYEGDFCITPVVKAETIDRAAKTLRFRWEGLRLLNMLETGTLKLVEDSQRDVNRWLKIINHTFFARGHAIKIVHPGEISAAVVASQSNADALAIDERTTRMLIEDPFLLKDLLEHKLHTKIEADERNLKRIIRYFGDLKVLRSVDLAYGAFKIGAIKNKNELHAILWALKFAGCAVSESEIMFYLKNA